MSDDSDGLLLDPAVGELVAAEKTRPDPPSEASTRVMSRLALALDLGGAASSVPHAPDAARAPAPPSTAVPSTTSSMSPQAAGAGARASLASFVARRAIRAIRPWALFLAGAAVGVGGDRVAQILANRSPPRVATSPSSVATPSLIAPRASDSAPPAVVPPVDPTTRDGVDRGAEPPRPTMPRSPRVQAPPPELALPASTPRARQEGSLGAERKLIEIARTAIGRGQYDGALQSLGKHAKLFPDGELEEEREGLWVQALVGHGDDAEARERGARFHQRHPRSLFAPAVDEALRSMR